MRVVILVSFYLNFKLPWETNCLTSLSQPFPTESQPPSPLSRHHRFIYHLPGAVGSQPASLTSLHSLDTMGLSITYLEPWVRNMRVLERHQLCTGWSISGINGLIHLKQVEGET